MQRQQVHSTRPMDQQRHVRTHQPPSRRLVCLFGTPTLSEADVRHDKRFGHIWDDPEDRKTRVVLFVVAYRGKVAGGHRLTPHDNVLEGTVVAICAECVQNMLYKSDA